MVGVREDINTESGQTDDVVET